MQSGFSFSGLSTFKAPSLSSTVLSFLEITRTLSSSVAEEMTCHPRLIFSAAKSPASKVPDISNTL